MSASTYGVIFMKKIAKKTALFAALFFSTCSLFSEEIGLSFVGRVAAFAPMSHQVKKIYGNVWADYQLEILQKITPRFQVWVGTGGFSRGGESIGDASDTTLNLMPLNLGVKLLFPACEEFHFYLGGAGCYSFLWIHDDSPYVEQDISDQAFGGLAQSGFNWRFWKNGVLNVFADYYFQKFSFKNKVAVGDEGPAVVRTNLNLFGFKAGGGIGIEF